MIGWVPDSTSNSVHRAMRREDVNQPVTMDDFHLALQRINSSVSSSDVKRHLAYMEEFGSV